MGAADTGEVSLCWRVSFFFFFRKKDIFTNMHNVGMIFTEIIRGIKGALCVFEEKKIPKTKEHSQYQ